MQRPDGLVHGVATRERVPLVNALDPIACSRCRRLVPVEETDRPQWVNSHVYAPVQPRPVMPSGTRADGTVVAPTEVRWMIEADSEKRGTVCALLCHDCMELLAHWIYLGAAAPARGEESHALT